MLRYLANLLCTLAITQVMGSGIARAQSYAPRVGQRHGELTLPRIDNGQPVSLSDYRGKKVLLIQFASW